MKTKSAVLAGNMKFLRKTNHMSQEGLARELGIKRSNIAAYESKNVEPKLTIIIKMAKFFNIDMLDLLQTPITSESDYTLFSDGKTGNYAGDNQDRIHFNQEDIDRFVEKSAQIKKILGGFKAFYEFRKDRLSDSPESQKLIYDIDNFLEVMEHMLNSNEDIIKTFQVEKDSVSISEES